MAVEKRDFGLSRKTTKGGGKEKIPKREAPGQKTKIQFPPP